jgi:flagellin-like protein
MNFEKVQRKNRKAISPVLATVILIAITLIAAIAIAGFVFGLFGTFTSGQNLQLVGSACSATKGNAVVFGTKTANNNGCVLALTNTGGAAASVTACTIYGATGSAVGAPVTVAAGTTSAAPVIVECDTTGAATLTPGAAVSGQLVVASGSPMAFSAISGS